ncbi:MAG: S9 family peptidase [Saprospiraceae bacterium]|nr:S9 family peptidase [Saprospiraceae bacterium]MCF8251274.1 S9 family peptidase [Saprospiraceae bacterium]MCF8280835.1 S9 family peptidase [Bacteroidales bacterium]MCF8311811.1 S9 family peptidase [Saprospiraceae bacterium]MCF8441952.1 S9 family peptidase [Saprospiraceae bacterium]
MNFRPSIFRSILIVFCSFAAISTSLGQQIKWASDGNSYLTSEDGGIVKYTLPALDKNVVVAKDLLKPEGADAPLKVEGFSITDDGNRALIYTNSKRVWRQKTRGDYWLFDLKTKSLMQLGKGRPASSLMFAKLSPDGTRAAYVSERNVYVEEISSGVIKKLTDDLGTKKLINGTFDWVYEEEFFCRDGFRWAPDSKSIAYWQIDANKIRDFYMINNTDSVYSQIVPVEYPKVGDPPSPARIGVVDIANAKTTWMNVPGDPAQHYLVRMEWTPDGTQIILQQLNRKQNESKIMLCEPNSGNTKTIFTETDEAWVSTVNEWSNDATGWYWLDGGKSFLWPSEKDGWEHLFVISTDGKKESLLTKGDYDVISLDRIDEKGGQVYFSASPNSAIQKYLYKVPLNGKGKAEQITATNLPGTHSYTISPNGKYARHRFSNYFTKPTTTWVELPSDKPLVGQEVVAKGYDPKAKENSNVEFFKVTTEDGVEMDGWMKKPNNFDPNKKYPVVFYVYGEPAGATVADSYGSANDFIYSGDLSEDGYIHVSIDNRGTPAPKGRAWRKAIYRNIGQVNIRDQAMGAKKILEAAYCDTSRVAVWGWSGGGSSTLNLMFQYPEIYKTGVSIAPVTSSLFYDNIYTERYMGLPQENMADYTAGAALTHAKNLKGNLMLVHGTGDDNVHFQNAEMLVNELVKYNKQFQYMAYPMRSHGLSEGEGTFLHLSTMVSKFLNENCPPGGVVRTNKP